MGWFGWLRRGHKEHANNEAEKSFRRNRRLQAVQGRQYLTEAPYFLPKDGQEINRLDFQHYLFRFALKGNYAAPVVAPADILDVGTGT